jgi:phage terminase small subunit
MSRGGSRPNAGRPRKDPTLKALAGTDRKDRDLALPDEVELGPMQPPMYLGDLEQLLFGTIAEILVQQKRASPHFAEHVALVAVRLAQVQRLKAVLEVEGDTFTSKTVKTVNGEQVVFEMVRARPEVAMLSDAMRQAQSLLGELMLNPAAALRLSSGPKAPAGAFDDF